MFNRVLSYLDRVVEVLLVIVVAAMVVVGGVQVFSRYVLSHSLSWTEEFQRFCHIWMVFLTIPVAYNRGSHIGMEVLRDKLPRKAQSFLIIVNDFLWLAFAAGVIFYSGRVIEVAKSQISPALLLPMNWVYLCVEIGGVYLALTALRKIGRHLRSFSPTENEGVPPC